MTHVYYLVGRNSQIFAMKIHAVCELHTFLCHLRLAESKDLQKKKKKNLCGLIPPQKKCKINVKP